MIDGMEVGVGKRRNETGGAEGYYEIIKDKEQSLVLKDQGWTISLIFIQTEGQLRGTQANTRANVQGIRYEHRCNFIRKWGDMPAP